MLIKVTPTTAIRASAIVYVQSFHKKRVGKTPIPPRVLIDYTVNTFLNGEECRQVMIVCETNREADDLASRIIHEATSIVSNAAKSDVESA